jgi:hypothetical protein
MNELDVAVNKPFLSTGETGEFVGEDVGLGLNPWVERAPPCRLLSNWRTGLGHENLLIVGDTGAVGGGCCCQ